MINGGQVPAGTVVNPSSLFTVPPGPATLLLSSSAGTILVGSGTNVAANNGFPVVATANQPVTIPVYPGNPRQTWSAFAPGGTATLSWLISAPTGGTGTGTLD